MLDIPRNWSEITSEVMKSSGFQTTGFAVVVALAVMCSTANVFSQVTTPTPMFHDITNMNTAQAEPATPATPYSPAPAEPTSAPAQPNPAAPVEPVAPSPTATPTAAQNLPYGVSEVLKLSQAKISDITIISYVQNSGVSYPLNASQIIYLKQQGVAEPVIDAMLNQREMMAERGAQPAQNDTSAPNATVAQPSTPAPDMSGAYGSPDQSSAYGSSAYSSWGNPYYYYPYSYYYPSSSWWWGSPTVSWWGPAWTWSWWWPTWSWWWPSTAWWGWGSRGFYRPYYGYYHGGYYGYRGGYYYRGGGYYGGGSYYNHGGGYYVPAGGSTFRGGGSWGGGGGMHGSGGWGGGHR